MRYDILSLSETDPWVMKHVWRAALTIWLLAGLYIEKIPQLQYILRSRDWWELPSFFCPPVGLCKEIMKQSMS